MIFSTDQVTVICTTLNEGDNIKNLLESLSNQTRPPDEIVIVDGGSTDNTISKIKEFSKDKQFLKLIVKDGINIAQGRNIAIKNSSYDIIAVTDAGSIPKEDWLEKLLLRMNKNIDIVSGFYLPDTRSKFEEMVSELLFPKLELIDENKFLPSSRSVCFRKKCWNQVNGYPEDSLTAEDTLFDLKLKEQNFNFKFAKDAIVYWRCRKNFHDLFKQWYLYATGDGILGLVTQETYGKKHYRKIIIEGYGFLISIILGILINPVIIFLFILFGFGYFSLIFLRKTKFSSRKKEFSIKDKLLGINILITVHTAQFFGIHNGFLKRSSFSKKSVNN